MPACEHCIHYDGCGYFWKDDDDMLDCEDFELSRFTFRECGNEMNLNPSLDRMFLCPCCHEPLNITKETEYRCGNLGNYWILLSDCPICKSIWEIMYDNHDKIVVSISTCNVFEKFGEMVEYCKVNQDVTGDENVV